MNINKIWVIYHNADSDGTSSGFLMKWAIENQIIKIPRKESHIKMFPFNYNFDIPWEKIDKDDIVFWLDVAGTPAEMKRMYEKLNGNMFWIDHHASIAQEHPEVHEECMGIRDFTKASCLNVYRFIEENGKFKNKEILKRKFQNFKHLLDIVGACDTWDLGQVDFDLNRWDSEYFTVKLAIDANYNNPTKPAGYDFWDEFMTEDEDVVIDMINDLRYDGGVILAFLNIRNKDLCQSYGAEIIFEGLKIFALNQGIGGSYIFNSIDLNKYDACMCFIKSCKTNTYTVSLYTNKKDINLLKSLEHVGYGGHEQAGGFKCNTMEWEYIDDGSKILKIT